MMITAELYILYGFLAFISLLLIAILGAIYRQGHSIGRIEGELRTLTARVERLEDQIGTVREQLAEVRGLVVAMHERVDLLMRHRHDDAGRVVITPEEVAAD